MKIIRSAKEVVEYLQKIRASKQLIGFVPTMGALHDGHLALVKRAKQETDFVVVSVFVNPTQFNNASDFEKYPNQIDKDLDLLSAAGVDCVFVPTVDQLYPQKSLLKFDFGYLEHIMEGKFRPGHFNGVATVVSKFFNFVSPDKAYFGQKDIQQVAVIKAMVVALSFQLELVVVPTLREESGLAMSSRNQRLTSAQFDQASVIYKALTRLKNQLLEGGDFNSLQQKESCELEQKGGFKVEYLELVDASTLENVAVVESGEYAICVAAYLGDVRLIDNLVFIAE